MVMYDTSKAAGFYSDKEGDETLDGYTDFLTCMEVAQDDESDIEAAEQICLDKSYRNTAIVSFFFNDSNDDTEDTDTTFLDEFMKDMDWL